MKYFAVLALITIAACAASTFAQSHSVSFGQINPTDIRLHHQYVIKKAKTLRVVSEDLTWPPPGMIKNRYITGIRITDQYVNGKGGYATMTSGGPGSSDVKLHFKSQRGHGYNFILEIYGR